MFSALVISTHFRMVDRYYLQIHRWCVLRDRRRRAAIELVLRRDRRLVGRALVLAVMLAAVLCRCIAVVLPDDIADARDFDRDGRQQVGPTNPAVTPIFDAVEMFTRPDDVIVYFRARTMTLYTDRLAIQTTDIDRVRDRADFYAQQRGSTYYQPELSMEEAEELGFTMVWSNSEWILWRVPPPEVG